MLLLFSSAVLNLSFQWLHDQFSEETAELPHTSPVSCAVCGPSAHALYLDLRQGQHTEPSISSPPSFQNLPCCLVYGFKSFHPWSGPTVSLHFSRMRLWCFFMKICIFFILNFLLIILLIQCTFLSSDTAEYLYLIHMRPTIYELRRDNVNTVRHSVCGLLSENMSQEKQDSRHKLRSPSQNQLLAVFHDVTI